MLQDIGGSAQIIIDIAVLVWLVLLTYWLSVVRDYQHGHYEDENAYDNLPSNPTDLVDDGSWQIKGMGTPEYFTEESKVGEHGAVVTSWEDLKETPEEEKDYYLQKKKNNEQSTN